MTWNISGLCECGCGAPTNIAPRSNTKRGLVKGKPVRFVHGHARRSSGVEYVEQDCGHDTPCWVWQLHCNASGYGTAYDPSAAGKKSLAHRLYYERKHGKVPSGLELDHLCRTRSCVNPAHVEPVSVEENVRRGLNAKLTHEQAAEIRVATGRQVDIAAKYGISQAQVSKIKLGRAWA